MGPHFHHLVKAFLILPDSDLLKLLLLKVHLVSIKLLKASHCLKIVSLREESALLIFLACLILLLDSLSLLISFVTIHESLISLAMEVWAWASFLLREISLWACHFDVLIVDIVSLDLATVNLVENYI